jgi:hypothetical protein
MSNDYFTSKDDKLDFKQICLGHYKRILEITTTEFTGGYWNYIQTANTTNKSYVTDKRKECTQAIESLALALFPHFDEEMKEAYKDYLNKDKELHKKYSDDDGFIRDNDGESNKVKHSIEKLELMKELFRSLSCLMYRLDYFKGATYHEGDDDLIDVDGGEK